jgi:hypothetical protein
MKYIPKSTTKWTMPSSVVVSQVEKDTYPAKLPSKYTPSDMILTEYFVSGTQPTEVSNRYAQLEEIENVKIENNKNKVTITWEYTTPEVITDEYINKFFKQSVFGNSTNQLIAERKKYNEEILGDIVFGIYEQSEDEELKLITYTNENEYQYTGTKSGNISLIIKAEHSKYSANASSGTKVNFKIEKEEPKKELLDVTLSGKTEVKTNVGTYSESGIKSIMYNNTNITNDTSVKITYGLKIGTETTTIDSITSLVESINKLPAGEYYITYTITYETEKTTKTRKLILE